MTQKQPQACKTKKQHKIKDKAQFNSILRCTHYLFISLINLFGWFILYYHHDYHCYYQVLPFLQAPTLFFYVYNDL